MLMRRRAVAPCACGDQRLLQAQNARRQNSTSATVQRQPVAGGVAWGVRQAAAVSLPSMPPAACAVARSPASGKEAGRPLEDHAGRENACRPVEKERPVLTRSSAFIPFRLAQAAVRLSSTTPAPAYQPPSFTQ